MHEGRHVVDIVQHRDVLELHGIEERLQPGGILHVFAGQKDKVHVFEAAQKGECVVHRRAKPDVRLRQTGPGHYQHDGLVGGEVELGKLFLAIVIRVESGANRNAGNANLCLGHLARSQRFGHKFVGNTE